MENNVVITPDSNIILLKTPFELDEENQLTFSNVTAQMTYFNSLPQLELVNATYQRKDGVLRWGGNFDDIIEYNYCMYQNSHFSNKWFFAFIEDIKFENPNMTSIKLKTDVFQTWQFDIVYKKMFVEREHVNDDTIGLHTVPENLETGEFICNKSSVMTYYNTGGGASTFSYNDLKVVIGVTRKYEDLSVVASGGEYGGLYSGIKYYAFSMSATTDINDFIQDYASNGYMNDIIAVFLAPASICSVGQYNAVVNQTGSPYEFTGKITRIQTIDGYTPKNKKLFVSPYSYLLIDNHGGGVAKINYEDLELGSNKFADIEFTIIGTLNPGCSFFLYPTQYKQNVGINRGLPYAKLPTLSWINDSYTNWLTQTAVNTQIGLIESGIGAGLLLASGGTLGKGQIFGGVSRIFNQLIETYQHQFDPAQSKGSLTSGDCLSADGRLEPTFYQMSIKSEYAHIIDDYFSAYGYKVNSYKIPNITGRTNWNYVKTSSCNILGTIPQKDLQALKNIFNNGVTFWHNPTTFLDYSQSNTIVS